MNINFKFLTCFHQTQSNSTDPEQTTFSDDIRLEVVQVIKSNLKTDYFLVFYYRIYKYKERIIF